jgi:hypothetical protein
MMLDALLETEVYDADVLECFFLEALYCSLGACLLDNGRAKFDDFVKKLSSLTTGHDEKALVGPGEIPGERGTIQAIGQIQSYFNLYSAIRYPKLQVIHKMNGWDVRSHRLPAYSV